ncbi:unnamed protein product [Tuber melanosporum]|uniref:(Perigord truffle) hypothetical protein n=1 Tax=Tuber melanosporum (strain Mel28) TaxID=656061 RepID=D5G404_TUBMM|nr:uncharacterized protein GSTUM_00003892001 [Tuber melanosporum]CAZ79247.1 unnamed protein product [Tuber melanosporum]
MTDDSSDRRKRSKWDEPQRSTSHGGRDRVRDYRDREPERGKSVSSRGASRWDDRRSRSPNPHNQFSSTRDDRRRSRSPPSVSRSTESPPVEPAKESKPDPAAAAAAAAARINAQIQAKRGIQHVDVPPIRSSAGKSSSPPSTTTFNSDMYIADGDYIKDIEVNDLRNRYTLTKGATQKMIKEETGADVTTRGAYYPDKSMATPQNPPLYLHITSTTKEGLEKAVSKIEELMKQDLPNLVDERRFKRREPPEPVERDEYGRRKWPEEKIPVNLEPIPGFNLRAAVVGHGGQYVKHIQQETRCRVQIKGRGSGFMEHGLGHESDEPLYLHVTGPDPREVQRAKELCDDLLTSVKSQYEDHKKQPQPIRFLNYGGGNNVNPYTSSMSGHGQPQGQNQGHNPHSLNHSHGQPASPPPPPPSAPPPQQAAVAASGAPGAHGASHVNPYAAYYGGAEPYAPYGGYQAYMQYCQAYYGQQQPQAPGASTYSAMPASSPPPPPPPAGNPPPPPPPPPSYNAVRPPGV